MSSDAPDNLHSSPAEIAAANLADGSARQRETARLGLFFGLLYFIQGVSEPTEGLITQPVRSLLKEWGYNAGQIGTFMMLLSVPWVIKPLFGMISDFVPLFRRRRKSYLMLMSAAAAVALIALYAVPSQRGSAGWLLVVLLVPTIGVAFGDVVTDALMIERGQPLKITGHLQAVQWGCSYGAMILTGITGGYLSQIGRQDISFLLCGLVMLPAVLMAALVREPDYVRRIVTPGQAFADLLDATRTPGVLAVGAFLFLWNFNPFSTAVLQLYMTDELKLGQQFYGTTVSIQAGAMVVASLAYGLYCRRVRMERLVHGSIVCGILATIGYWGLFGAMSAVIVAIAVGLTYMTATLIQLDLAAQVCPPRTAGTIFALLMALSNLGTSAGIGIGGYLYDWGAVWFGSRVASFHVLVGVGATFTAGCWLIVPYLRRPTVEIALANGAESPDSPI